MDFTDQQRQAIYTHDCNLVVVAGAGSGKTRVLVERYLTLLDANPDWPLSSLVAITFTKKAAGEMRDRVRKALEDRYYGVTNPSEADRWSNLLAEIDSARIDTIHGLCATILRANAAEVGIDPDFVVLDEVEARILLDEVIEWVLADVATSAHPAVELLTEYESRDVRKILSNSALSGGLASRVLTDDVDDLFEHWRAEWWAGIPSQLETFRRQVEAIGTVVPPDDGDKLAELWHSCLDCLDQIGNADVETSLNRLDEIANLKIGNAGKAASWGSKDDADTARKVLQLVRDAARATRAAIGDEPGMLEQRAAHLLPLWITLLRAVRAAYSEAKANQSVLDFDDLERLTCDLLDNHPDVRARYRGTEFKHVLVDEFQDTNAAQWQIVQALTGLENPGTLFVVGDPKQSIYAFRGADVRVFGSVFEQICASGGKDTQLYTSFRTHQPLVNCFNTVFRKLLVRDSPDPRIAPYQVELGTPMDASRSNPPDPVVPLVELLLIDQCEYDEQGQQQGEKLSAEDRRQWEAFEIAGRIRALVEGGRVIYDKDRRQHRPMQYDDVAILFQSLSNVTLYEDVFKTVGLPFVTLAGRGYYDRQEVWDLLNLLQAVYNPADNLSLAAALRSPLFGLSDDALLALRLNRDASVGAQHAAPLQETASHGDSRAQTLWEALANPGDLLPEDERRKVAFARECLDALRRIAGRMTISALLRTALERTGYLAVLTGLPDGARKRGNILKLLDKAESSGKVTLGAFSQYLRDLSAREVREGEAAVDVTGTVQIMTVHASKGLEFPVVVLADASWERGGSMQDVAIADPDYGIACKVYDGGGGKFVPTYRFRVVGQIVKGREEAERLRLLYVAATRAQDYLIVSGQVTETKTGWSAGGWLGWLLDALELQESLSLCLDVTLEYTWGKLHVTLPRQRPLDMDTQQANVLDWGADTTTITPVMPELLKDVPIRLETQVRHLAATHIADLGSAEHAGGDEWFYRQRFRRQVLQDVPTIVEWVSGEKGRPSARQVGEIVHQALRHWRLPGEDAHLRDMLYSYAWRQGITDEAQCEYAVSRAIDLLLDFQNSEICRWIHAARTVYRELPFVYERQGCVIHGVIDALFRMPDGRWMIVDYKTSTVSPHTPEAITAHARRYHLQVGVYADAVQSQLGGDVPETYIHYVRYGHTVQIHEMEWRNTLSHSLTERILAVIEDRM